MTEDEYTAAWDALIAKARALHEKPGTSGMSLAECTAHYDAEAERYAAALRE